MNIVHLLGVANLPPDPDEAETSGVTRVALEVARVQASHGHSVSVLVVRDEPWNQRWRGVELVSIKPFPVGKIRIGTRVIDLREQIATAFFCRRRHVDIVHGHLVSYMRFIPARCRVAHFHGDPFFSGSMLQDQLRFKSEDFATVAKYSDVQIGVSEYVSGEVRRGMAGAGNVLTIPNGIDLEQYGTDASVCAGQAYREQLGISQDAIVIMFAGSVTPEKGLLNLARTFHRISSRFTDVHLLVAGSIGLWGVADEIPEFRRAYEAEVRQALQDVQDKVHFLGSVSSLFMPTVYASCDMVVIPSMVKEGWPLVALEALASGRPVVASHVGGLPEIIDGSCGFLVPPGNEEELEATLLKMIGNDKLRQRLGQAGKEIASKFTWERTVEQIEAVYRAVLESK